MDHKDESILTPTESSSLQQKSSPSDVSMVDVSAKGMSGPPPEPNALDRLEQLLARTRQFSSMLSRRRTAAVPGSPSGRHTTNRVRQTEEQEDKTLLADEEKEDDELPIRLMAQPTIIAGKMRHYQLEALNWLIGLYHGNLNGILADEMGLGKTLETISMLGYLRQYRNVKGPHLIIVPKSTMTNWAREIKRWCEPIQTMTFHGNKEQRSTMKPLLSQTDVTITTYEMCLLEKGAISKVDWHYVIIDEAHRIKNTDSKLSIAVRQFPTKHRLLITGTPLQNNLTELWALLNFLVPELFSSGEDFKSWFDVSDDDNRDQVVARLHTILRPFLLRRLKVDVEKSLPPKIETKLFVGLSAMQRSWYTKILSRDIDVLNSNTKGKGKGKMRLLNIVMQLRKVCNHPYLFEGAEPGPPYIEGPHLWENCGKMVLLHKLLIKLKQQDSRVLIFSQMTRLLDILDDYCRFLGYEYCRIDGQTSQEDRDAGMDAFNAPDSKKFIFLLSTRAGGLGINLQTADTVILYDSDWNPQMDLQAQDRAHRIGQKKQVHVYRFVTENSVEEKIVERATKKLYLDAIVIKQGRMMDKHKAANAKELQSMVRFGAERVFQSKESTITDEDIDAIIARGRERTDEDNAKLQDSENTLLNFSFNGEETSFYEFEGKSYEGAKPKAPLLPFIAPPKRDRKTNYNVSDYFSATLNSSTRTSGPPKIKPFKASHRPDFQFYRKDRLEELERKKWDAQQQLRVLVYQHKQKVRLEKQMQAAKEKEAKIAARRAAKLEAMAEKAALANEGENEEDEEDEEEGEEEEKKSDDFEEGSQNQEEKKTDNDESAEVDDAAEKQRLDQLRADEEFAKQLLKEEALTSRSSRRSSSNNVKQEAETGSDEDEDKMDIDEDITIEQKNNKSKGSAKKPKKPKVWTPGTRRSSRNITQTNQTIGETSESSTTSKRSSGSRKGSGKKSSREEPEYMKKLRKEANCLTSKEEEELEKLLAEGFSDWNRQDFRTFLKANEQVGRDAWEQIVTMVPGKTQERVEEYWDVFWDRYEELKDHQKYIKAIERGEAKIERNLEIKQNLQTKLDRHNSPLRTLTINYPNTQRNYTPEEDRFLVYKMHQLGFGNWNEIQRAAQLHPGFRFDWWIKSRKAIEIQRRCELLLRHIETENKAEAAKAKKRKRSTKKTSGKQSSTKGKTKKTSSKKTSPKGGSKRKSSTKKLTKSRKKSRR